MAPHFETAHHRRDVLAGVRRGVLPLKFAYAGSAAFTHDQYSRTDAYIELMASAAYDAMVLATAGRSYLSGGHIVDIGPGNGVRSGYFLDELVANDFPMRRYLALDFSTTLLRLAQANVVAHQPVPPEVAVASWDFEAGPTVSVEKWRQRVFPLVACLLGNTLGNVESPLTALSNIQQALRPGDLIIASVLLRHADVSTAEMLAPYRSAVFRAAAIEPLRAAGFNAQYIDLNLSVENGTVVGDVLLRAGASRRLRTDHAVRCFTSRRFMPDDVSRLFAASGWSIHNVVADPTGTHLVVLATVTQRGADVC